MSKSSLQADLTLSTKCGSSTHLVVYRVSVWGHAFLAFNPCDQISIHIRRLIGAGCVSIVDRVRSELQSIALFDLESSRNNLTSSMEDIDPRDELCDFVQHTHQNRLNYAHGILPGHDESNLIRAFDYGDAAQQWAAVIVSCTLDRIGPKILTRLRSLSNSSNVVTRAACLLAISTSRRVDNLRCVGESLLDRQLSLPVRDALVRNLTGVDANYPLDSITCDLQSPWGGQSSASWSEIRQASNSEAERVLQVHLARDGAQHKLHT